MFAQDNIKWAKSVKELGNDYNTKMSDDIDLITLYPNYLLLKIGGGGGMHYCYLLSQSNVVYNCHLKDGALYLYICALLT